MGSSPSSWVSKGHQALLISAVSNVSSTRLCLRCSPRELPCHSWISCPQTAIGLVWGMVQVVPGDFRVQPRLSAAVLGDIWDLRHSVNHSLGFCGL